MYMMRVMTVSLLSGSGETDVQMLRTRRPLRAM